MKKDHKKHKNNEYDRFNEPLDLWKEMMCTKMQQALQYCRTPDGVLYMLEGCRGKCRYSHKPLEDNK